MPEVPVNVMDQYHPDMFCDPRGASYDPRYAEIARRPTAAEINDAYRHAKARGLTYEAIIHEKGLLGIFS
jgi:putative pyruvate formate lyase activating enzyme